MWTWNLCTLWMLPPRWLLLHGLPEFSLSRCWAARPQQLRTNTGLCWECCIWKRVRLKWQRFEPAVFWMTWGSNQSSRFCLTLMTAWQGVHFLILCPCTIWTMPYITSWRNFEIAGTALCSISSRSNSTPLQNISAKPTTVRDSASTSFWTTRRWQILRNKVFPRCLNHVARPSSSIGGNTGTKFSHGWQEDLDSWCGWTLHPSVRRQVILVTILVILTTCSAMQSWSAWACCLRTNMLQQRFGAWPVQCAFFAIGVML